MTDLRAAGGERTPGRWRLCVGLMATLLATLIAAAAPAAARAARNPLAGRAMWIWVLGSSDGGNLGSIIGQAHAEGVSTLMIKSGDGSGTWSQFNSGVVATLHHAGLRVCAWQYVYGEHPISEAYVGAAAVKAGADCLLIDAESEYEGKYVQAQSYIGRLRKLIGARFPVALAGFPYVDYHPGFPYSVFLGPGAAQYNVPQMYWKDIGTSVDDVYAHTFVFNRPYKRAIFPWARSTTARRPPRSSVSASSRARTPPAGSAGGTGRRRPARGGEPWPRRSARSTGSLPTPPTPRWAAGPAAIWWCGRRSICAPPASR